MNKYLKFVVAIFMALSMSQMCYADKFQEDGDMSDTNIESTDTLFRYDPSLSAEGIRCSLYKGETYTGKTFNILNHPPVETNLSSCFSLGNSPKTETTSWEDTEIEGFYDSSIPSIGTDSAAMREYVQNDNAIATYASAFQVPEAEIRSGAYSVLIEPIVQIRIGSPANTIMGTPTEISYFILDDGYILYNAATGKNLTAKQFDSLMYDNYPNLFHRRVPSSMYVTEGRLGLNPGSAGKFYSSEIKSRSFGSGAFILYKGSNLCPYKGGARHGSPEAKNPTDDNSPCTCCPWTGPWSALTIDENDNGNIPAIKLYNKEPIDSGKYPHGSPEAKNPANGTSTCICIPKNQSTERPTDVIPKDYLNMVFKSETVEVEPDDDETYVGCDPKDYEYARDIPGSRISRHYEIGGYEGYWEFLGDRQYTANGTNLVISRAYNDFSTLPEAINHYTIAYEKDHEVDSNLSATASLPNVYVEFEEDDDDDGDSHRHKHPSER